MASKPVKQEENLKDKIKNLFRRKPDQTTVLKPSKDITTVFTPEILKDIGPESPGNNRIKTIKELSDVVLKKRLEDRAVEAVWVSIQDLILPQTVSEKRHVALQFLQCILEGQFNNLGGLRCHFFHVIKSLTLPENIGEKLTLLKTLSENGKNLLEFELEAGRFLLDWFPEVVAAGRSSELLPLLISVIKFNAAYIDEDIIAGLVRQTCAICNKKKSLEDEIKLCLDVIDAVLCYSYLPSDTLRDVIAALCRMVNIPKYCEPSWELMRKLLGTHLGHSSIYAMCSMLQSSDQPVDFNLLRGAIFYIGMALWGSRKVQFLKHTPAAILPSFLHVLSLGNLMIAYEVTLSVQRLVKKYGKELPETTWDIVLTILETVQRQLETAQDLSANPRFPADLHDTLTTIEQLHEHGQFSGSLEHFFKITELCAPKRPEPSVILLISHLSQGIHPGREHWMALLNHLLDRYYRSEKRTKIRLKALDVLSFVLGINKHMFEEELIGNIVLLHLCHIESDPDVNVRKCAVEILLNLLQTCSSSSFIDLVAIVDKVISQPQVGRQLSTFPAKDPSCEIILDESHLQDVKRAVSLMVDLFKVKLYTYPPGMCVKLYDLLIGHISHHYSEPSQYSSHTAAAVRKCIIECLLNVRADVYQRVGVFDRASENSLKYSPYITCNKSEVRSPPRSPVTVSTPTLVVSQWALCSYLEYSKAFSVFLHCLEMESDWGVLKCVLDNLPLLLQNKTIVLTAKRNLIDSLCSRLCAMINDRQLGFPEKLVGVPKEFTRSDFHAAVFPVLGAMSTYHNYLDRNKQRELIKCLEFGMVSKCAKLCVNALRLCTLEMQEVMMRLLPSVLMQLSKISATIFMAIPVLAFLSSIVRLPKMYANFVEDEYMSVFAIALPYTNPFKFSHYTVSLAHHVIAIWFIRCRLPFRKGFVQFIQKGLKQNVLQQFEENARLALQSQNQDSSDRVRSGSYSEAALRSQLEMFNRRRMQSGSAVARSEVSAPVDEKLSQFHRELTETCTDIMSRYACGNFSALPHRSHMAEFLLAGGQSQTWLLGNKLITITTSGSGVKAPNSSVCEKCNAAYQNVERENRSSSRRRHRSAVVFSRSSSTIGGEPGKRSSQDDMTVKSRTSLDDMSLDIELPGQDVGVQTGSSLSESAGLESEPLESLLLGIKGSDQIKLNVCNCWSTNWAEVYIRAPSGNTSWMMRIENEAGLYSLQDSQIPDITMLFASMGKKREPFARHSHRIESGSIGEEEYETLYKQHFENLKIDHGKTAQDKSDLPQISEHVTGSHPPATQTGSYGFTPTSGAFLEAPSSSSNTSSESHQVSQALQIPSPADSAANHDLSPGSLRRSNSSPSILSGSLDTLSPRDNISDIVLQQPSQLSVLSQPSQAGTLSPHEGASAADQVIQSTSSELSHTSSVLNQQSDASMPVAEQLQTVVQGSTLIPPASSNGQTQNVVMTGVQNDPSLGLLNMKDLNSLEETKENKETSQTKLAKSVENKDKSNLTETKPKDTTNNVPVPTKSDNVKIPSSKAVKFGSENVENTSKEFTSMLTKQLSPSTDSSESSSAHDEVGELPGNIQRRRGHTIAVVQSSGVAGALGLESGVRAASSSKDPKIGVSPSFVFLQLYHSGQLQVHEPPLLLPNNETTDRSIKLLDYIYPYETHKIGILYVGRNQVNDEKAILSNECGSERYMRFLHSLGSLVRLKDCDARKVYLGGLDTNGNDGEFTYTWQDESTHLVFHIATLMPTKESSNNKKLHIGNDYVTVVYNDSGEEYKIGVIKGQFNYVNIVIKPLDYESNAVTLQAKEVPFQDKITTDIAGILGHTDTKIISDTNLAGLVRQIAIHCNLASMVLQRQASQPQDPFANNWLERLRKIRRMRTLIKHDPDKPESPVKTFDDFTQYV